jgi:hypothetical protein
VDAGTLPVGSIPCGPIDYVMTGSGKLVTHAGRDGKPRFAISSGQLDAVLTGPTGRTVTLHISGPVRYEPSAAAPTRAILTGPSLIYTPTTLMYVTGRTIIDVTDSGLSIASTTGRSTDLCPLLVP